jgi:hypothetical protein
MRAFTAVLAFLIVLTGTTAGTAGAAPNVSPGLSCASGDDWLDYAYVIDPTGGSTVDGYLCEDHVTTGDYWAVEVRDSLPDGKCAHAGVIWRPASGNPVGDFGMYVCGNDATATFRSLVRNWTLYRSTELSAFVDNGASAAAPAYEF